MRMQAYTIRSDVPTRFKALLDCMGGVRFEASRQHPDITMQIIVMIWKRYVAKMPATFCFIF